MQNEETNEATLEVQACFDAMKRHMPDDAGAMGLSDDYTKATLFIEKLKETVRKYFTEYAQIPPKPVVLESARMLIDAMLVTVALPRAIEKYFMIFGLNAVETLYDYLVAYDEVPSIPGDEEKSNPVTDY